jgi:hypothetical protein
MTSDRARRDQVDDLPVAELVFRASVQTSQLIREEFRLARAELPGGSASAAVCSALPG